MNNIQNYDLKTNTPSFKAFKMSNRAKRIIQNRIKNQKQWETLDQLVKSQETNPVDVIIDYANTKNGKLILRAHAGNYEQWDKYGIEGYSLDSKSISGFLFNPIKYIKKICKMANKAEQSLNDFHEVLKDIPQA